jgi:hypothetical protein
VIASGGLLAAEIRGTLKKVDPSRNCILVTVGDEERKIELAPKTQVYTLVTVGRRRRASVQLQQNPDGINSLQPGMFVTVQTRDRDGVEMATEIRQDNSGYSGSGRGRRR